MNIAFPAVIIFILALPGIILRYSYRKGTWKSPISIGPITEETSYSIFFAAALHIGWTWFVSVLGYRIDLQSVLYILTGSFEPGGPSINSIISFPIEIALYFLSLYAISYGLGLFAHIMVRSYGWDRKFTFLRFANEWFYLLTGEILEFPEIRGDSYVIDGVYFSAVVQHGEKNYLYRGIVSDFYFDKKGNLDRVLLRLAHRRSLEEDREITLDGEDVVDEKEKRYYDIEGDFFLLRYSEVKTINIQYFAFDE